MVMIFEAINQPASTVSDGLLLPAWFNSEAGVALLDQEMKALDTLVPDQFYQTGMQYGAADHQILSRFNVEKKACLERDILPDQSSKQEGDPCSRVVALPEALPFPESSIDLAIYIHTLDFCDDPHHALREINQTISPEGVLVIVGFHPYSWWGLGRLVGKRLNRKHDLYGARFLSRTVVQDWVELLGFQSIAGKVVNYQFPYLNEKWRSRMSSMDSMGDRWWPTMGAVYILVVQKKIYSGLKTRAKARAGKNWFPHLRPSQAKVSNRFVRK